MAQFSPDVLVRRRSSLLVVIAAAATGLTAGYLWRFSSSARPLDLVIGLLLAAIAVGHVYAWTDSRRPLLVADGTGVRIRLGSAWAGLPWDRVDAVEVENRGRVKDGLVAVRASGSADPLAGAGRRARWVAALNRRFYGASLVAPYGLTTTVSVPDLGEAMERLAEGRTSIVVSGADARSDDEPMTTAVTAVRGDADIDDIDDVTATAPVAEETDRPNDPTPGRPPRRRVWAARSQPPPAPAVVSMPRQARREERTLSLRPAPSSIGALALSEPNETSAPELPEIEELHRPVHGEHSEPGQSPDVDPVAGNVSLIIDATTDLSAQAMQRVRQPNNRVDARDDAHRAPVSGDGSGGGAVIGRNLAYARETLGLTVDELADRTRIRPSVIESIERDDFVPCGGDFYAKGHLRMLARVLGIEATPILQAFDDNFATSPVNARDVFEAELAGGSSGLLRGGPSGAHWGAVIAAVVALLVVWGAVRIFADTSDPTPTAGTGTSGTRVAASPGPASPPAVTPAQGHVQVTVAGGDTRVVVRNRSMRVVFSGVLAGGTVRHFHGTAPLRVHAADAGLVSLSAYGRDLGALGTQGAPAYRVIPAAHSTR